MNVNAPAAGTTQDLAADVVKALRQGGSVAVVGEAGAGASSLVGRIVALHGAAARTGGLRTLSDRTLLPFHRVMGDLPTEDPEQVADLVLAHLGRTGERLLVCEDLQWFDDTSIVTLGALRGRVPLLWTERVPAGVTDRLAPTEVVRVPTLAPEEARELLHGLGVAEDRIGDVLRAGSGHPARLRELAGGRRSQLLSADLVAPLLDSPAELRRRAAWLAHVGAVEPDGSAASAEAAALIDLGLVWRTDEGVVVRFDEVGPAAESSLAPDDRRALHLELAEHWRDDLVRRARHLALAGRSAEAATAAFEATATAPVGPELTEMWTIAAAGAPTELRAGRRLRAADAAARDADDDDALQHLDLACADSSAVSADPAWRRVRAIALAGTGRPEAALSVLGADPEPSGDDTALDDALCSLAAELLAWPMLRWEEAARLAPENPFVAEVIALLRLDGAALARDASVDPVSAAAGTPDSRIALLAACVPGLAEVARARVAHHGGADGRRSWAELAAAEQVVELLTIGSCAAATSMLDRWCTDPVLRAHQAPLTSHVAVATADTGATGEAVARLAALAPDRTGPAGHAALVAWARAEVELAAARPRRAAAAANAAMAAAPTGSLLHDAALVAAAWTAELGVEVPAGEPPRLAAAAHEVHGVGRLLAQDWHLARAAFLDAAQGWRGVLCRSELRCRWGAAEAGRHAGVATAVEELSDVERIADELGQRALVARARASLRNAGVRRAPRRGGHPSGLTLREVEVLERVAAGLTSGEIGQQLGVARSTVDTLADSARRKLGAKNRRHAALLLGEVR